MARTSASQLEAHSKGQWVEIKARNPASVCCDEALLACALQSVGVALHPIPHFAFYKWSEEIAGETVHFWRWKLAPCSQDGAYATSDLIAWWKDPAWLAAHPQHEFAIVARILRNLGGQALAIRSKVARVVVKRGDSEVHIPVTATPARRAHLCGQLEGRIPLTEKFVEPSAAT